MYNWLLLSVAVTMHQKSSSDSWAVSNSTQFLIQKCVYLGFPLCRKPSMILHLDTTQTQVLVFVELMFQSDVVWINWSFLEGDFDGQTILGKREGSILDSILWGHHRIPAKCSTILSTYCHTTISILGDFFSPQMKKFIVRNDVNFSISHTCTLLWDDVIKPKFPAWLAHSLGMSGPHCQMAWMYWAWVQPTH